jgi:hypothetical protein
MDDRRGSEVLTSLVVTGAGEGDGMRCRMTEEPRIYRQRQGRETAAGKGGEPVGARGRRRGGGRRGFGGAKGRNAHAGWPACARRMIEPRREKGLAACRVGCRSHHLRLPRHRPARPCPAAAASRIPYRTHGLQTKIVSSWPGSLRA